VESSRLVSDFVLDWLRGYLGRRRLNEILNLGNEAITAFGQGFQKARVVGVVFQGGANLSNCEVETLLKIYEGFRTPDLLGQFLACNHFPWAADQQPQDFGRLWLKFQRSPIPSQFSVAAVQFKSAEANTSGRF
jgi:hypothetical protein